MDEWSVIYIQTRYLGYSERLCGKRHGHFVTYGSILECSSDSKAVKVGAKWIKLGCPDAEWLKAQFVDRHYIGPPILKEMLTKKIC